MTDGNNKNQEEEKKRAQHDLHIFPLIQQCSDIDEKQYRNEIIVIYKVFKKIFYGPDRKIVCQNGKDVFIAVRRCPVIPATPEFHFQTGY